MATLLSILPIFAVIALGWMLRRTRVLDPGADATLFRVSVNVLYPCLLFDSIVANPALTSGATVWIAPCLGFVLAAGGILAARLLAGAAGAGDARSRGTFGLATGMFNWSYLPLPIVLAQFGRETAGVLAVFSLGVEVAMWSVGVLVLTSTSDLRGLRRLLNGPIFGIAAALAANLVQNGLWVPAALREGVHLVGMASIPIGLLLVGLSFCDHFGQAKWRHQGRAVAAACVLRLGLFPLAFLALAAALPVSLELKRVLLVQAAMPGAVFPLVLARLYDGDAPLALLIILGTTAASIATIPLWMTYGAAWLGL